VRREGDSAHLAYMGRRLCPFLLEPVAVLVMLLAESSGAVGSVASPNGTGPRHEYRQRLKQSCFAMARVMRFADTAGVYESLTSEGRADLPLTSRAALARHRVVRSAESGASKLHFAAWMSACLRSCRPHLSASRPVPSAVMKPAHAAADAMSLTTFDRADTLHCLGTSRQGSGMARAARTAPGLSILAQGCDADGYHASTNNDSPIRSSSSVSVESTDSQGG
jgi:hypothetical protein